MLFLEAAAAGQWEQAVVHANKEIPEVGWDEALLFDFFESLAPWVESNTQDQAQAVKALVPSTFSGTELYELYRNWFWLAQLAKGYGDEAAAHASTLLKFPESECTGEYLGACVCSIMQSETADSEVAAGELFQYVLRGEYTLKHFEAFLSSPQQDAVDVDSYWEEYGEVPQVNTSTHDENATERTRNPVLRKNTEAAFVDHVSQYLFGEGSQWSAERDQNTSSGSSRTAAQGKKSKSAGQLDNAAVDELINSINVNAEKKKQEPALKEQGLDELRAQSSDAIRAHNKEYYRREKTQPLSFAVYGSGTQQPVLVLGDYQVPPAASADCTGFLKVVETGSLSNKAGRLFGTRPNGKLSSDSLAGIMQVEVRSGNLDLLELQLLVKKGKITQKKLMLHGDSTEPIAHKVYSSIADFLERGFGTPEWKRLQQIARRGGFINSVDFLEACIRMETMPSVFKNFLLESAARKVELAYVEIKEDTQHTPELCATIAQDIRQQIAERYALQIIGIITIG
ncbi:hypothetical protein [Streptomyces sp. NPDC051014]|uniref:hypothetical protein n=1 Tax=Streptomyces sp. NPDC051014 TaxID=3155751 RepID=UPI0033EF6536